MAFIETERVRIRRYLGYSRLYLHTDSRLESVITAVQSQGDGGSFPDSSTEDAIRSDLERLGRLEVAMEDLWAQAQALDADGLKIDVARAMSVLRSDGRRIVGHIADALEVSPRRDVFAPKPLAIR